MVALVILQACQAINAQNQAYFSALPDIPMPLGVQEIESESIVFDKPEGRFIQSVGFLSGITKESCAKIYKNVIENLGWSQSESIAFVGYSEVLQLKINEIQGEVLLTSELAPLSR